MYNRYILHTPIKSIIYNVAGEPTPDINRTEFTFLYAARLSRIW